MSDQFTRVYEFGELDRYNFKQKFVIRTAGLVFYWMVRLIGRTIRFETEGLERFDEIAREGKLPIYAFWHDRIVSGTYYFRDRGIIVLSSTSFDSEYTARCIQRFGFGIIKGSSTRGGIQALVGMIRMMKQGFAMAFTLDGPKGPRYEAKSGPVLLAKKTGNPLVPFVIECKRFWTIKSWDRLQIPKPFTRARLMVGEPVYVEQDARDERLEEKRLELQTRLDKLVEDGERWRNFSGQS
ncbi:MAG TPA: lysophospholipid acyltransferase family protein [Pyrinomonadaceae bacterium]|nr:lysophospholipid acyltransferase family protein [Pyrinomonadaceae bacterium]HMP64398.1 lysophospholipid acyltransferase family protein [Pyrinomonadaceae bacterium]